MIFTGVLVLSLNTNFAYIACAITLADAVYNAVVLAMYPDWTLAVSFAWPRRFLAIASNLIFLVLPSQMMLKHQEAARSRFRQ